MFMFSIKSGVLSYFDLKTCLFSKLYIRVRHDKNVRSGRYCVTGKRYTILVEVWRDCCTWCVRKVKTLNAWLDNCKAVATPQTPAETYILT